MNKHTIIPGSPRANEWETETWYEIGLDHGTRNYAAHQSSPTLRRNFSIYQIGYAKGQIIYKKQQLQKLVTG